MHLVKVLCITLSLALFVLLTSAANLEAPEGFIWTRSSGSGCNTTVEGEAWTLTCTSRIYSVLAIRYYPGAFCTHYSLTCSAATGRPSCHVFNNGTEAARIATNNQTPNELGLIYVGGCTAQNGASRCYSTNGTYPDLEKTTPYLVLTKTNYSSDPITKVTIDCSGGRGGNLDREPLSPSLAPGPSSSTAGRRKLISTSIQQSELASLEEISQKSAQIEFAFGASASSILGCISLLAGAGTIAILAVAKRTTLAQGFRDNF